MTIHKIEKIVTFSLRYKGSNQFEKWLRFIIFPYQHCYKNISKQCVHSGILRQSKISVTWKELRSWGVWVLCLIFHCRQTDIQLVPPISISYDIKTSHELWTSHLINGDPNYPTIKTIPPPPLHTVLLGPINHVFSALEKNSPKSSKQFPNPISRNQNTIAVILKEINVELFWDLFTHWRYQTKEVLLAINKQILPCNYSKIIYDFWSVWFELIDEFDDISTTPKTHILLDPLEDDFNLRITTLIKDIYELYENIHQFLNKILMKSFYFVKAISNPSHSSWGLLDTSTTYR